MLGHRARRLSAVTWAVGSFLSARLTMPRDVLVATTLRDARRRAAAPALRAGRQPDPAVDPRDSVLAFLYLVTFGSVIGFTAYIWLLDHAPLGTVSTYAYVNPVVAIALGVLFHDES